MSQNCVANARLVREGPFDNVHIPPDHGDGGTCVCTALYVDAREGGAVTAATRYGPYGGSAHDAARGVTILDLVEPEHVRRHLKRGLDAAREFTIRHEAHPSERGLVEEVAKRLSVGQAVGWFQGRGELGPRALGHRSILARPDDVALARRLARDAKDRAAFRSHALAMKARDAPRLLDLPPERASNLRWMKFAAHVRGRCGSACRRAFTWTARPSPRSADRTTPPPPRAARRAREALRARVADQHLVQPQRIPDRADAGRGDRDVPANWYERARARRNGGLVTWLTGAAR